MHGAEGAQQWGAGTEFPPDPRVCKSTQSTHQQEPGSSIPQHIPAPTHPSTGICPARQGTSFIWAKIFCSGGWKGLTQVWDSGSSERGRVQHLRWVRLFPAGSWACKVPSIINYPQQIAGLVSPSAIRCRDQIPRPYREGHISGCKVGGDLLQAGATCSQHLWNSHPGKNVSSRLSPWPLPNLGREEANLFWGPEMLRCVVVALMQHPGEGGNPSRTLQANSSRLNHGLSSLCSAGRCHNHIQALIFTRHPGRVHALGAAKNRPSPSQDRSQPFGPPGRSGSPCSI